MMTEDERKLQHDLLNEKPGQGHIERPAPDAHQTQAVRSYARATPKRTGGAGRALFDRSSTDKARPIVVGMLAFLFLGLSWVSTTVQTGIILAGAGAVIAPKAMLVIGLAVAMAITVCEVVFSESIWYWPFLAIDTGLTLWWVWPGMVAWGETTHTGSYGALVLGGMIGLVGAYLPERVLFGQRRK